MKLKLLTAEASNGVASIDTSTNSQVSVSLVVVWRLVVVGTVTQRVLIRTVAAGPSPVVRGTPIDDVTGNFGVARAAVVADQVVRLPSSSEPLSAA